MDGIRDINDTGTLLNNVDYKWSVKNVTDMKLLYISLLMTSTAPRHTKSLIGTEWEYLN